MSYTLTTLRTSIQDYTENDETTFVSNLRNFIRSTYSLNPHIVQPIFETYSVDILKELL